ncbi:ABC transporter substrate-binding protein [Thalassospira lucentensis]|uniref:Probable sugar-binding periplasmic protein n=1 Tax=Thalassospira lucentensis TaxID=168935 RepID=A0A358HNZ8_9PROT|nr:ABC transporter substrate-binding protein [Thalassospira lucentensis]HBU96905.1 sugar ABC transporter substrate-binding protein [Thalassospira lucentensis]HCW66104.1 sugar ABC transporter substrate-binding protein [Thalassospira lucentensis]
MYLRKTILATGVALSALATASFAHAEPTAEVLHWWTSGGEAKAVAALKEDFEAKGGKWVDSPVAGGAGDAAMTVLRSRVLSGDAPAAVQLKGPAIQEWAEEGALADLNDVAAAENWDDVIPAAIQDVMKYEGDYVAVPVNIHRVDWIWANPTLLAKVGADTVPTTWDEFNALADKLQAAGITPVAHGGQPWQDATIFETVVLGLGGPEFYQEALVDLDDDALNSDTMKAVFDQMRKIRGYVDADFPGRDWNLATAMVMNGDAAMQIMGDWAKGEFLAAGKVPGKDFLCAPTPSENGYLFNTDSFAMFNVSGDDKIAGQKLLAELIVGEKFQETFNLLKGSIPARLGVPMDKFDDCAKKSEADLKSAQDAGGFLPSMAHGMALRGHLSGAIVDVVTAHFNSDMTSDEAVSRLVEAVELAKD